MQHQITLFFGILFMQVVHGLADMHLLKHKHICTCTCLHTHRHNAHTHTYLERKGDALKAFYVTMAIAQALCLSSP
jgi:hypothetical protein